MKERSLDLEAMQEAAIVLWALTTLLLFLLTGNWDDEPTVRTCGVQNEGPGMSHFY